MLGDTDRVKTQEQLIHLIGASEYEGETKAREIHVKRLRSRSETDPSNPRYLVTVRGLGYKFEAA